MEREREIDVSDRQAVVVLSSLQLNTEQRSHASAEEIGNVKHARLEKQSEGLQTSSMASTMGKNMHSRHAHVGRNRKCARTRTQPQKAIQILNHLLHSTANKSAT